MINPCVQTSPVGPCVLTLCMKSSMGSPAVSASRGGTEASILESEACVPRLSWLGGAESSWCFLTELHKQKKRRGQGGQLFACQEEDPQYHVEDVEVEDDDLKEEHHDAKDDL